MHLRRRAGLKVSPCCLYQLRSLSMKGTKQTNDLKSDRPTSRRRRIATERVGRKNAKAIMKLSGCVAVFEKASNPCAGAITAPSTRPITTFTIKKKSIHHQNSARVARPENVAYFDKTVRIASMKDIRGLQQRFLYGLLNPDR